MAKIQQCFNGVYSRMADLELFKTVKVRAIHSILLILVLTFLFLWRSRLTVTEYMPEYCLSAANPYTLNRCMTCPNVKTKVGFNVSEFYQTDLVSTNHLTNKLSHLLKHEPELIEETQRIHLNIFYNLIGKYKYAMLFNIAGFENKGDPAIGVGEIILLRRLNIELVFHLEDNRNTDDAIAYAEKLSNNYSTKTLVVLLHGGGNLLSYAHQDIYRKRILHRFRTFEVIMFPQSLWIFTDKEHLNYFKTVYSSHPWLTFCYRDKYSYDQGSNLFPKARSLLVPDMAFQIGKVERFINPIHDIMWLQRKDEEAPHYEIPEKAKKYNIMVADWREWLTPNENRTIEHIFSITANGMMFLQRGRVVITDRLHGHILSVLCGIPHVVLDPINNKISHYTDTWTGGLENVVTAKTPEDALDKAIDLLHKLDMKIPKTISYRKNTYK